MRYTNKSNLPASLEDAIKKNTYDLSQSNPNILSITTILNPPKVKQLSLRHWNELERDVADSIWLLLGSSVHSVMERINADNRLIEERMYIDTTTWDVIDKQHIDPLKVYLAGKPDLYCGTTCFVEDYKVTSTYTVQDGRIEWEQQLNLYAWLYRKLGFEVKGLRIIAILKDWSRAKAFREGADYPQTPALGIEIPLWTEEKQLEFMKQRLALHLQYRDTADDAIPECSPEERWASAEKWAVMKVGGSKATKLFEDESPANEMVVKLNTAGTNVAKSPAKRDVYIVEHRKGENIRCQYYCDVAKFCHFFKQKYNVTSS